MKPRSTLGSREETYLTSVVLAYFPKCGWLPGVTASRTGRAHGTLAFFFLLFFNQTVSLVSKPESTNITFRVIHPGVNGCVARDLSRRCHLLFCRISTDNAEKS